MTQKVRISTAVWAPPRDIESGCRTVLYGWRGTSVTQLMGLAGEKFQPGTSKTISWWRPQLWEWRAADRALGESFKEQGSYRPFKSDGVMECFLPDNAEYSTCLKMFWKWTGFTWKDTAVTHRSWCLTMTPPPPPSRHHCQNFSKSPSSVVNRQIHMSSHWVSPTVTYLWADSQANCDRLWEAFVYNLTVTDRLTDWQIGWQINS